MDWNYFKNQNDCFEIRRLPGPKGSAVWFKDTTDLCDHPPVLSGTFDGAVQRYESLFSHSSCYRVEVENFYEAAAKNRKNFLGELAPLQGHVDLFRALVAAWENEDAAWHFVPQFVGNALVASGLFETTTFTPAIWDLYLQTLPPTDYPTLADGRLTLTGTASQKREQLCRALTAGTLNPTPPFPIRPTPAFGTAVESLQVHYVACLAEGLAHGYPETYQRAVLLTALAVNQDWSILRREIIERWGLVLSEGPPPKRDSSETFPPPEDGAVQPRTVRFTYQSARGKITHREVTVTHLYEQFGVLYLHGICADTREERTFRFDRMIDTVTSLYNQHEFPASSVTSIEEARRFLNTDDHQPIEPAISLSGCGTVLVTLLIIIFFLYNL